MRRLHPINRGYIVWRFFIAIGAYAATMNTYVSIRLARPWYTILFEAVVALWAGLSTLGYVLSFRTNHQIDQATIDHLIADRKRPR